MVDINKLKARLDAVNQKTKDRDSYKKDKVELFYKPTTVGTHLFRAVEYPHSNDPDSEPFAERHYHFNIPGQYAVYCPQKNDGKKCAVCEFVWDNLKANKGNKPVIDEWRDRLPQLQVMVAGKPVDENGEDIETSARFVKFRSDLEKMSDVHLKLYKNFKDEPTWMDWDKGGCNLEMGYEAPSEAQKKQFKNASIMMKKGGVDLARHKTQGFKSKAAHDKFIASIPNLDETAPFTKKNSEDMTEILTKWMEIAEKKLGIKAPDTKSTGMTAAADEVPEVPETQVEPEETEVKSEETVAPKQVKLSKLKDKLASLGVK